jgi:hypothetical protein
VVSLPCNFLFEGDLGALASAHNPARSFHQRHTKSNAGGEGRWLLPVLTCAFGSAAGALCATEKLLFLCLAWGFEGRLPLGAAIMCPWG